MKKGLKRIWASLSKETNLFLKNNFSLLQNTYLRLEGIKNLRKPIIISNQEQRFIVAEQMREIDVNPQSILLEPVGKNTAPAITLGALKALENNNDPKLFIRKFREILNEDEQPLKNVETFKCINLKLHN